MFSAYCEHCGSKVLLTTRRIELLHNTEHGIVVIFRCWQGHLGSWLTGRGAEGAAGGHVNVAAVA